MMSDIENTTENDTAKPVVAPYMKKDSEQNKTSSKSNLVIPLILLLVSAIVIITTFYEDEYNGLISQNDTAEELATKEASTDATAITVPANAQDTETAAVATRKIDAADKTTDVALKASEHSITADTAITTDNTNTTTTKAVSVTPVVSETAAEKIVSNAVSTQPVQASDSVVAIKTNTSQQRSGAQPMYAHYQRNPYAKPQSYEQARQQAMARAKNYNAMMQQRREAYEKEMQARRQYDEAAWQAAMKAQQERRARMAEAQKAVFQRIEQNRIESRQRMEEMHKRISAMHEEIHQMMRDSLTQQKSSAPVQIQSPSIEQM